MTLGAGEGTLDQATVKDYIVRGTGNKVPANTSLYDVLTAIEGSGFATGTDSLKILSDVLDAIEGSTFNETTDSLEALRDLLDDMAGSSFATANDSLKVLSDVIDLIRTELTFQHQADATLSQASPVQDTWYAVLDTTLNCRLYSINVAVATTGETLEVKLTIDGQTYSRSFAATAGSNYRMRITSYNGTLIHNPGITDAVVLGPYDGRSIKVEVRKTTANGTGTLTGRVVYATR